MHTEYKSIYSVVYIFAVCLQSLINITSINKENTLEEKTTLSLHMYLLYYLDVSVVIYILGIYYCTCICVVDV